MFAFFGLGLQEIILLGFLAAIGLGLTVVLLVVSRSSASSRSALEEENRRLQDELDRRREKS